MSSDRHVFGRFEFRPVDRQLLQDGQPVQLGARALDLLKYLIEHRDRVVGKDELINSVWPGLVVEDNNLTVQISAIRKLLGAQALVTVSGRGYKFAMDVSKAVDIAPLGPTSNFVESSRQLSGTSGTKSSPLPRMSIVVLPFNNASGDPSQDYFSDGITEEVTTHLSKIRGSYVVGKSTAFSYKGTNPDIKALRRELEVRYVLQGSVERHDGGVDTNVQLINAQTGAILWADSVEVEKSGVRNIRKEVVNRLAVALNLQLISVEASRSRLENPDNPDAFDLVMQGWAIFTGLSLENGRTAQSYFDRALTLQPDSQPALVGRAATLFSQAFGFHPPDSDQLVAQSEAAAIKAIDLEPQDAHAHYVIARVRLLQGQIEAGLAEIENCLSLNSNIVAAHAWKGFLLVCNGKPRLAIDEIRQALTQSPKDTFRGVWMFWMGYAYFYCSEYVESVRWFERSTYWGAILLAVAAYTLMSEPKQAQRAKERLLSVHPGFTLTYFQDLDYVQHPDLADMRFKLWQALRESGLPE